MDSGAHFHRCDFQVHTPRDRNWEGGDASTETERKEYATEFVSACRAKGLDAVAITDHHDLAFVQYIRNAASVELDLDGVLVPAERQLTVFPGMELTLGVPCQALLIFDANLPKDLFALVIHALAIQQSPEIDNRCVDVVRMDGILSFSQLYDVLDKHEYLRGRYIILPNVSEGGSTTLLRTGHTSHYKDMPCVGGYLDGGIAQLKEGTRSILSGKVPAYGNKNLGLFPTSDNRHRNFDKLGTHVAYVKWATPTAEALRQACLACQSRINHSLPFTPSVVITSMAVSASKFLGRINLDLNPQYNAIIGGRGTGKSTILEYLRWALCDDNSQVMTDTEGTEPQLKRSSLVEKTLAELNASVQVGFLVNGVPHVVRRQSKSREILLKIGAGNLEPATELDVRTILPIQAYSQKQLSSVGVRLEELKRFIKAPIRQDLDDIERRFATTGANLRAQYASLRKKKQAESNLRNLDRELRSLTEQVAAQRSALTGIEPTDQDIIANQVRYEAADTYVTAVETDMETVRANVSSLIELVRKMSARAEPVEDAPHVEVLKSLKVGIDIALDTAMENLVAIEQEFAEAAKATGVIGGHQADWRTLREAFIVTYEEAKNRSTAHGAVLIQLNELEVRAKELRSRSAVIQTEISTAGDPETRFNDLQQEWIALYQERATLVRNQCSRLTELSGNFIRVDLNACGDTREIEERLKAIFAGVRIPSNKIEDLCFKVQSAENSLTFWTIILAEFELIALAHEAQNGNQPFPNTPTLSDTFSENELKRMMTKISPDNWLDLFLLVIEDQPTFKYRSREAEYIPFADASAGQQATALLWALLNQEGPPLVIDQPEDDLDNQIILDVVNQIWKAKSKRQLIFTSHNANLVVNGDAELVICCDYQVAGEQSSGFIKCEGAIDMPIIRDEIAKIMEGGKQAFKLRMDKYGF